MKLLPHVPQKVGMSELNDGKRSRLYAGSMRCERCKAVHVISADICPSSVKIATMRHEEKPGGAA